VPSIGPTPARSIGPTHRRGTATINTGVSQEGPSDLAKDGALFTFKDERSLARPATARSAHTAFLAVPTLPAIGLPPGAEPQ
jgi:hypothetical protein